MVIKRYNKSVKFTFTLKIILFRSLEKVCILLQIKPVYGLFYYVFSDRKSMKKQV